MPLKTFNVYDNQNKAVQDAYDMLTANIHILNNKQKFKTFALTSCNPQEGKTSLVISLAISMAHAGWKVLLVDADMRKPPAAKRLNQDSLIGLSDYLAGETELLDVVNKTNIPNLTYFSCGSDNKNPIELLCSIRFEQLLEKTQTKYDFILFDTPALGTVVDATVIASKVDATLLVVKPGYTTLTSLKRVKDQLEKSDAKILGIVLNKVKKRDYKRYLSAYNYFLDKKRFFKKSEKIYLPSNEGNSKSYLKF